MMSSKYFPKIDFSKIVSRMNSKKILITGGTGFVGKNICEILNCLNIFHNLNMKIAVLGRNEVEQVGVTFIRHDITHPILINENFDYIIHAASPLDLKNNDFDQTIETIISGTKNILEFSKRINCSRLLLISSGAVCGEQPPTLDKIPEEFVVSDSIGNLNSAYAIGKKLSEFKALEFCKDSGLTLTIARCFAFSGRYLPLDKHFAIGNFIRDAINSNPIKINGDGRPLRSYLDSEDLVLWLLTILLYGEKNDIYNVGSDQGITIKDLADKVASYFNNIDVIVENKTNITSKRNLYIPSIEKAKTNLNLNVMTSLDSSIEKMIKFNREMR